jgi:hypothetical protein
MNLIKSRNVEFTTEPHITYTPCYTQYELLRKNADFKYK